MKSCPQCGKEYDAQTKFCPTDGSTLRSASGDDIIGSVIADRYHVIRKLGEGGMGQVYLAEHVKMGRMSAIKVMTASLVHDADAVGRFNREASNASKITHPNIAAIYDFGETSDGLIYLAMEFVEGESLTKLCEALGALPAPRAAEISRQVASALEAAHERGIVHRDLKPDNIMISRGRDGTDLVKVVDFGIAKAATGEGQKVTRTGLVVGTPEYMSPEQLTGDTLDGRSDLYALALVTFNMLTGSLPFTGQTTQEALLKRLTDRPLTLVEARPDLRWPPQLQQVLDRALSRLATDRYQHASEFGAALVAAVAGMRANAPETAPMQQPGAAPSPTGASAGITVGAPAMAPAPAVPAAASARQRLLVPAILLAAVIVVVGGALYQRSRSARAASSLANVTAAPSVDTAASSIAPPVAPPAVADSTPRSADSTNAAAASEAAPSTTTAAPTPPPAVTESVPAPAPAPAPAATRARGRRRSAVGERAGIASRGTSTTAMPPSAEPPAAPAPPPDASVTGAPATAEQARAQVDVAGRLLEKGKPGEAVLALRGAMPLLPTRDDSVTALYYLAEGVIQRSAKTGDQAAHKRGCSILGLIAKASSHPKAGEIQSLYSQECK